MLVCPRFGAGGEAQHPHPLWDELMAQADDAAAAVLERETPISGKALTLSARAPRELPKAHRTWSAGAGLIEPRDTSSPSSIAKFLGCSFHWALHYIGKVRPGTAAQLPEGPLLYGRIVHELLARVVTANPASPERAAELARELFDTEAPRLAGTLYLPGADDIREDVRLTCSESARDLVRILQQANMTVRSAEQSYKRATLATTLDGTPDLVVGPPTAVIDLKWGGVKWRRQELEKGTAIQLARCTATS
jgi:hypothetical protein